MTSATIVLPTGPRRRPLPRTGSAAEAVSSVSATIYDYDDNRVVLVTGGLGVRVSVEVLQTGYRPMVFDAGIIRR
jgi:hypothetical protein